jgi:predicted nuclease of restriction endonuclease-like (RecB) superfamily
MKDIQVLSLFEKIAEVIQSSRKQVRQQVNNVLLMTYWQIGKIIIEDELKGNYRADYGKEVLKSLSDRLTSDFGKGFDIRNLQYMKQFYKNFPNANALRSELSWTHYRLLFKVESEKARKWYLEEAINDNWSTRALERQINSFYYERLLSSQNKEPVIREAKQKTAELVPHDILKDPYVLEFLELQNRPHYTETELESALIEHMQKFLLELGRGFSFVARQKHIDLDGEHFYIDLVFYNYILKCFLLIDLKRGKLTHQDIGKMDTYIRIYEDKVRQSDDNPTIGLILCSEKNSAIVKYSILSENKQLFASKYKLLLPTEEQLAEQIRMDRNQIENLISRH